MREPPKASTLQERYEGSLLGLAVGDALGAAVEFKPRGSFAPVASMLGGGPFRLAPGQWTDYTSMALCLAESLVEHRYDAGDQMQRFWRWWREGYWSSTGRCFDIGATTRAALLRYESSRDPYAGDSSPDTAGNGSLMRLAPVALYFHPSEEDVRRYAADHSSLTHGAPEALECCQLLALALCRALAGTDKSQWLDGAVGYLREDPVAAIAAGVYLTKPVEQIRGTGYAVQSLEAALWCLQRTDSFREPCSRR